MRIIGYTALALAAASAVALASAPAHAQIASDAFAIRATFHSGGAETALGRIDLAWSNGAGKNSDTNTLNTWKNVFGIASGVTEVATLTTMISHSVAKASFSGIGIDNFSNDANTAVKTLTTTLQAYPPPPATTTVIPEPLLVVTASGIADDAAGADVVPQPPVMTGTSSITSLMVSGSLIGNSPVTFAGTAAPNTVLFNSNGVKIVANEQITVEHVDCSKGVCTVKRDAIRVHALAVHLDAVALPAVQGKPNAPDLSGDIIIGGARASLD